MGRLRWWLVSLGLAVALSAGPRETLAMGKWLERKLTGDAGGEFWKDVEKAIPLIKQRADAMLTQLGYDPTAFTGQVYVNGEGGDEAWKVKYKAGRHAPDDLLAMKGDLAVFLNNRGIVKRVMKYVEGKEQLLYGKDERLAKGMTPTQVIERLGNPDVKGLPPRELRDMFDEMWTYKSTANRTVGIEVYFKNGKVSTDATFGE